MPELPEVETVRAGLEALVLGATVVDVEIRRDSCVRLMPGGAAAFADAVIGGRIDEIARRGKFLWVPLAGDDAGVQTALSAHLGMSGQFRVFEDTPPEAHTHCRARLSLTRNGTPLTLDFLDQRTFGYLHAEGLVPTTDHQPGGQGTARKAVPASVAHIARDALDPHLSEAAAVRGLRKGSRAIKQVLLDQTVVSGIGNIYADEALWLARIQPEREANMLTGVAARMLLDSVKEIMTTALGHGGTSFDALYVNVNGESGYFSRHLAVYGRAGQPCERCGGMITVERIGGRSTHWCQRCQRRFARRTTRD
ncbi:bifunctional DNA-formamidopyrimidine glycosylase/DNA-(apurinic or apyrimidinic site) lyase [Demequina sp.]|uniref:bifunctional DNA-formamidopyrimidine glycosylase/DNA-(apurinic or apyrimidinic site) lyase n=1 Tax=Demequina sp. TaxID=2050685 RepID=UPI0025C17780|nr:bifunctional DNA-formamidopyrimidine glycosylase/DNA-(apurinic or apyrimidinic site) lyase [Demequina sp.]